VTWQKGGKNVITGSSKGEIIVWNCHVNDRKANDVHTSSVLALCWTNYEKYLLSGDKTGEIVYSDQKITLRCKLIAHDKHLVKDITFSPASLKFISCSTDTTARVFDFLTAKEEFEFKGHGSDVNSCHWHPTSCLVATGSKDMYVKLWDPRNGKEVHNMQPHNKPVT